MELTHDFTVPASVDDAWGTFMDLERVGSCFPGATVTSVDESGFVPDAKPAVAAPLRPILGPQRGCRGDENTRRNDFDDAMSGTPLS